MKYKNNTIFFIYIFTKIVILFYSLSDALCLYIYQLCIFHLDPCSVQKEVGHCDKPEQKYFFSIQSQSCEEFMYNGCGGTPNRFSSQVECQTVCIEKHEPPIPTDEVTPAVNQGKFF